MTLPKAGRVILLVGVASAVLSLATSLLLTQTDAGRRWVAGQAERVVSDAIPGRLRIGRLIDLGPPLLAEDVRFYHPDGRVVLLAKHAEVVFDLGQALAGRLAFERVDVDGGRIDLSLDPDGRVAFEAAVDAPTKPAEPDDPSAGLRYDLSSMHVENFEVAMKLSELADYSVHDVEGFIAVRRIETNGARVKLEKISGRLKPDLLGARTAFRRIDGWVHGRQEHVMHMEADLAIGDGKLDSVIDYYDRPEVPTQIRVRRSSGTGDLISGLLSLGDSLFGDALEVEVDD